MLLFVIGKYQRKSQPKDFNMLTGQYVPTEKWTERDRNHAVIEIAQQMKQASASKCLMPAEQVYDWSERILFLLTKDSGFLQANREQILNGLI